MLPTPIRFKLHFGPYRTPRFKIGGVVEDELRGDVKIVGLSDARISWPVALNWRVRSLVVYRDLARAVRRESAQAVAHWWDVSIEKVRLIRRALGVPAINEGSKWLQKRFARSPEFRRMARMAWANAGSPERRAMARNAMLGKSQPEHVRRKIAAAKLGRIQSAATRRKIGAALKRNGTWRCWTAAETALLKQLLPQDAAERTGRSLRAVYNRRKRLGLSSMLPRDLRFKLHFGAYRSPRFKYGAVVEDLLRGPVQIVGMSDAKIPWPIGKKGGAKSLILYKGLAKAVRKESHQAIRYWWGVGGNTVWRWRKALGVRPINEGTHRLKIRYGQEPFFKRAQRFSCCQSPRSPATRQDRCIKARQAATAGGRRKDCRG